MCSSLLGNHIQGAQEQEGPDDVIEDHHAEERHEDPQRHNHHQPRPLDDPVQPQGDEDELQDVDRAQDLQLEGPVVSEAPHAGGHGHGGYEEEWHENQQPEVGPPLHSVAHQDFEHEQQQMDAHGDQHGFELHAGFPLCAVARVSGPNARAHRGADDDQELPQPYRGEDSPVAPLDDAVQAEGQQHGEEQQAGVDEELTRVEVLEQAPGVHGEAAARPLGPAAQSRSAGAASAPLPGPAASPARPASPLGGQPRGAGEEEVPACSAETGTRARAVTWAGRKRGGAWRARPRSPSDPRGPGRLGDQEPGAASAPPPPAFTPYPFGKQLLRVAPGGRGG